MDDLLSLLLAFPPHPTPSQPLSDQRYDEHIRAHIKNVKNVSPEKLLRPTANGEGLLDVINPSLNTVSYVFVLTANIAALQSQSTASIDSTILWQKMADFLTSFDARQMRYLGQQLADVIATVTSFGRQVRDTAASMGLIASAILRLDPAGSTMTSYHLLITQLALESQAYEDALPIIDRPVSYFPGTSSQPKPKFPCVLGLSGHQYITLESGLTQRLKYQNILEYFIYSGTIYIGLHQWEEALEALENAITYPAKGDAVSMIMVEAYKKWTLVNILHTGKAGSLPSTTSSNAVKIFHALAKPYDIVASMFESATASRLNAEVSAGQDIWTQDGTSGLLLCLLGAYQEFQIRNLANVYRTLSISQVTNMTTSAETGKPLPNDAATEALIVNMITRKVLDATISRPLNSPAVLTFSQSGVVVSEVDMQQALAGSLERIKAINEDIKAADRRITHEKEYLRWASKPKKGSVSAENYVPEWNLGIDEDLMDS